MKVIATMPIFGRPIVTGFSIRVAKALRDIDRLIVVGSTEEDAKTAEVVGVEYYSHPNLPLGEKWQRCFTEALKYHPDYILFLGSDDWWEPSLAKNLLKSAEGNAMVAPMLWGLLDLNKPRSAHSLHYNTRRDGIGSGRLFDVGFIMEKLGGILYEADVPFEGMDGYASNKIWKAGGRICASPDPLIAYLRYDEGMQIYSIEEYLSSPNISAVPVNLEEPWVVKILTDWDEWLKSQK